MVAEKLWWPNRDGGRVTSVYATRSVVRWRTTNDTTNFGGDETTRDRETAGGKSWTRGPLLAP